MLRRESNNKNEALVNYQDIVFGKVLGRGAFGEVYHGTWRHNDVAVKKLLMKNITSESAQEFEAESQIMARLRSPNIVQFYGYAIEPERCIVMEYCPNGSLYSVLHSKQPLEWTIRIKIALGAVKGLAFLHEEKILHRDIKSLNILLTEHFEAKLTDFGLSKLKTESESEASIHNKSSKKAVGTVQWMAPEMLSFSRKGTFTQKSDIYSLGVTFWELASRQIPFASAASRDLIPVWVLQGAREDIPTDCPPAFGSLIQECWTAEPSTRPDANAITTQLKNFLEGFSAQKLDNAPSPNPSPDPAPSGPQYLSNLVSEDASKPLVFSPPQLKQPALINTPRPQASPEAVAAFLKLIAEGEQDQAETLLKKDATLGLLSSNVTDLSDRTFKGITGFQYAVWALDWHMWTMILKYLPKDQVAEQIKAMDEGSWVFRHRKSGDWLIQKLVDVLQTQINLLSQSKWNESEIHWKIKVGGAQRSLPVHVVNEYCDRSRSFHPCPDFLSNYLYLPRTRNIDEEGEWFTATYNGGKLGEKFGVYRGAWYNGCIALASGGCRPERGAFSSWAGQWRGAPPGILPVFAADLKACQTLLAIRTQQRNQLFAKFLGSPQNTNNTRSPNPSPDPAPSSPQYLSNLVSEEAPKPLVFSPPKSPAHINTPRPVEAQITKQSSKDLLLNTLSGHDGPVYCLQLLPSGELVSGSEDKTLKVWDLGTGTCLKTLVGHSDTIWCLQLLSSGELVSGSSDSTIKVWDIRTGTCLKTLKGHDGSVFCLQHLPSGELVSGAWDKTLKVWDIRTGTCLKTLKGHDGPVFCLQHLPSGELVSGSDDYTIKIWDLRTGTCLKTLEEHYRPVFCLQHLPSGELVSGSGDETLKVWDLRKGKCLKTLEGHAKVVRCLQRLPNGELVSGSADKTLKIWDLKMGTCLKTLEGHTNAVRCLQRLPSGELVSGSADNTLKVWDLTEFSLAPVIEEKKAQRPRK